MRTADPHLIYDISSKIRINPSKDVLVGDHVWIGQSAFLMKGSIIGSGSIVGGASVIARKTIPSNTIWAGNPARQIRGDIAWDSRCVHAYYQRDSLSAESMLNGVDGGFGYSYIKEALSRSALFDLSEELKAIPCASSRCDKLIELFFSEAKHDRFGILPKDFGSTERNPSKCFVSRLISGGGSRWRNASKAD